MILVELVVVLRLDDLSENFIGNGLIRAKHDVTCNKQRKGKEEDPKGDVDED